MTNKELIEQARAWELCRMADGRVDIPDTVRIVRELANALEAADKRPTWEEVRRALSAIYYDGMWREIR